MRKFILLLPLVLLLSCSRHTTIGAGYGKTYNSEPTAVIDSVLATRGLSESNLKWSTRQYADEIAGKKTAVTASTALYRMQNDSTLIITVFSFNGKYRLVWRVEKEAKTNY